MGAAIDSRLNFSLDQMQRFRAQQQGVYEDGVSDTRIDLARLGVERSYNDDAEFTRNLHVADQELVHQLTRKGGAPAAIATARAGQVSQFWRDRGAAAIANKDLAGSQRYLDQAKDLLTPGDRAAWSARLQDAVTNDKADQETQRILQLPVPGASPGGASPVSASRVVASPVGAPSTGDASQASTDQAGAGPQGPASGGRIAALETGPRPPDL